MIRDGHEDVSYFIGPEVEKTPAADKRTLFVVGKQDVDQIERMAREYKTPHIFLGANQSFGYENPGDNTYWNKTITALLDKGFWVTLDYKSHLHEVVLEMLSPGIWQSRLFVPLLSVRIPHVQTSSPNLTIKIDDIDFNATNEGVWCLNHHEVTDSNRFTPWQDYSSDEVVAPLAGPAHILPLKIPTPVQMVHKAAPEVITANIERMPESVVKNETELGLDVEGTSKLKADPDAVEAVKALDVIDAAAAADAYAEGAKEDPLGKTGTTKRSKAK
jgi:hypothetical protein